MPHDWSRENQLVFGCDSGNEKSCGCIPTSVFAIYENMSSLIRTEPVDVH
jgi:hypothetical protein